MKIVVSRTCPLCRQNTAIDVNLQEYIKFEEGLNIDEAFPSLEPWERKLLATGKCLDCQTLFESRFLDS